MSLSEKRLNVIENYYQLSIYCYLFAERFIQRLGGRGGARTIRVVKSTARGVEACVKGCFNVVIGGGGGGLGRREICIFRYSCRG